MRKQEVWLKVPPRSSDTDTGSETEVKLSQVCIDYTPQELPIPSDSASVNASIDMNSISNLIKPAKLSPPPKTVNSDTNSKDPLDSLEMILKSETKVPTCPLDYVPGSIENYTQNSKLTITDSIQTNLVNSECRIKNNGVISEIAASESKLVKEIESGESNQHEILLPDAILSNQIDKTGRFGNVENNNLQVNGDNLPDLLTSSPRLSRQTSPGSISDTNQSFETVCTTLSDEDLKEEASDENMNFLTESETVSKSSIYNEKSASLKLQIDKKKLAPIVTVTAPTPTFETLNDSLFCESTMLNVPKDDELRPCENSANYTPFDHLKEEVKQRKAKNKAEINELRPLSKEDAREQMSKYFERNKNENKSFRKSSLVNNQDISEVEVVELQIKSKLSDKVEQKDLLKYFDRKDSLKKYESGSKDNMEIPHEKIEIRENKIHLDLGSSIQDFNFANEIDSEAVDEQFNKIEVENEITNETDNNAFSDILLDSLVSNTKHNISKEDSKIESIVNSEQSPKLDTDSVKNISNSDFNSDLKPEEINNITSRVSVDKNNLSFNDYKDLDKSAKPLNQREEIKSVIIHKKHLNIEKVNLPKIQNAAVQKVKVMEKDIPSISITNGLSKGEENSSEIPNNEPKKPERKHQVQDSTPQTPKIQRKKSGKFKVTPNGKNKNEVVDLKIKANSDLHGSFGSLASSKAEKKKDKCTIS